MADNDNFFVSPARYIIKNLKFLGLWPWGRNEFDPNLINFKRGKLNIFLQQTYRYILHVPLSFTYLALMWTQILKSKSVEEAGDIVYIGLTETALVIKLLNAWILGETAWQLMHEISCTPEYKLRTQTECIFWQREQQFFKRVILFYVNFSLAIIIVANLGVLFAPEYELPFAFWVPFEWRDPKHYWYPYIYGLLAMPLTCFSNTNLDSLICYFMLHSSLMLQILGMRIEALNKLNEEQVKKELYKIFLLDQKIRILTKKCEEFASMPILIQIICSALVLCFSGYRLINVNIGENIGQFLTMTQYVGSMTLQIFLPCYYANEVSVSSYALTNHVYNCDWLHFSPSTQKIIYYYMESLKRPVKIRSGNFFEVGIPIFSKTINNAYSILAVLINIDKKK